MFGALDVNICIWSEVGPTDSPCTRFSRSMPGVGKECPVGCGVTSCFVSGQTSIRIVCK